MLGKPRSTHKEEKPHNLIYVCLGTGILWFGWYGFNGGSSITSTARGAMAAVVTTLAASTGALAWMLMDFLKTRKYSAIAFCGGAVSGLVAVTPAAGYIAPWAAIIIGTTAGIVCRAGCRLKLLLKIDDSLDAFGVHGVGGLWGSVLTGIFAQNWVAALDGSTISPGWVDGNWIQIGYQIAGAVVIAAWSFFVSLALLFLINKIPGFDLRPSEEYASLGNDPLELGEYSCDYFMSIEKKSEMLLKNDSIETVMA